MPVNMEIECKIPVPEREALAARLRDAGAIDHGDALEKNQVFDKQGELRAERKLLRVRETNGTVVITYKGPPEPSTYKQRTEIEIVADSFTNACLIFEGLGYTPAWYYEKFRHAFTLGSCDIALDHLPELGFFIEVEGPDVQSVTNVLTQLGHTPEEHLPNSYLGLYCQHCEATGKPVGELRFPAP